MLTSAAGAQTTGTGSASAILKNGDDLSISGSSIRRTINANGKPISVNGSSNALTIRGSCPELSVSGSSNTIYVDSVAAISFSGSSNRVYWRTSSTRSGQPSVSQTGSNNKASRAAGSSQTLSPSQSRTSSKPPVASKSGSAKEIVITDSGINQTLAANGRPIRILGSQAKLTVSGACPRLTLIGSGCSVTLESVGSLNINGSANNVVWQSSSNASGKPQIANTGTGNRISRR